MLVAIVVCELASLAPLHAAPPSIFSIFQKKSAAVSDADLQLKDEHGPWLILAATLSGDDAEGKAIALAKELRQTLGVEAFIHEKVFDHSAILGSATYSDELGGTKPRTRVVRHANATRERSFAVLVGSFTSTESPQLEKVLKSIKSANPKALQAADDARTSTSLISNQRSKYWKLSKREENQKKGKMGAAFVTRNPLLPDEFFQAVKVDDYVARLNQTKAIKHSLLDCPGRFTVRVASFEGRFATDFGNGSKASELGEPTDILEHAALQAHRMVAALREKEVEAYEFHDRYGSYVMIGSFDTLGESLPDGQFQYHPGIVQILQQYCGYQIVDAKDSVTGAVQRVPSTKSIAKIPFDVEGKAMAVPRPSTTKLYGGSLLGKH